jgi:tetrahydromethanopterin S-methyltransferase subunit A
LPVPAYNTFNEILDSLDADDCDPIVPVKTELIKPSVFTTENWPRLPGNYNVANAKKSIALVVLQSVGFDHAQLAKLNSEIAIVGSIMTENIGVEHLTKNLIANPFIRHLVLWGEDIEGHLPGNALVNLLRNGVDKTKRINRARGARPVLKNITSSEVDHLMHQIQAINLIGRRDMAELAKQLEVLSKQTVRPYEAGLIVDLVDVEKANPARSLKLDPRGYFVIMVMKDKENPLLIEHYSNDGVLRNMVEGKNSASICATLIEKKLITQLDHAAYLGRELAKAELSISLDTPYTQDRAQGDFF